MTRQRSSIIGAFAALAAWAIGTTALAQPPRPPARPSRPPATTPAPATPAEPPPAQIPPTPRMHPALPLGLRLQEAARKLPAMETVVVVPDARSYAAAVATWSMTVRFPVLIDDGTWTARENIARFVRAFEPKKVVRWTAPTDFTLPAPGPDRERLLIESAARAWGATDEAGLKAKWKQYNFAPPGLVVMHSGDTAWTAGLALAAARGQVIAFVPAPPADSTGAYTMTQAIDLGKAIDAAAKASGYDYQAQGDVLEAVTLTLNAPIRVMIDARGGPSDGGVFSPKTGEPIATTDLIGRVLKPDASAFTGARWAWTGQIIGTEAQAAYRAMCAIYVQPRSAFLFDGYDDKQAAFRSFDATAATRILTEAKFPFQLHDAPSQSIEDWRKAVAGALAPRLLRDKPKDGEKDSDPPMLGGLDAGWIMVNSSGMANYFQVNPGTGFAGDMPLLARPAIVHFVHSFSSQNPVIRETIAGRMLEHGAYAYVGSIFEPYLSAFVPTPMYVGRSLIQLPLGAAARLDDSQVWRVAVNGDPLITIFPPGVVGRAKGAPALSGATDIDEQMRTAAAAKNYAATFAALHLLARDHEAARLARALLDQHADQVTPAVAREAVMSAFRDADVATFTALAAILIKDKDAAKCTDLPDAVWHALWPLRADLTPAQTDLLRSCLRPEQASRDAGEIARSIEQRQGLSASLAFLRETAARTSDPGEKTKIEEIIEKASRGGR